MAFQNREMSVIAYANGFTMWHYGEKEDTVKGIAMVNFFGSVWTLMAVGDIILLNASDGAAQLVVTKIEKDKVWTKIMSQVEY